MRTLCAIVYVPLALVGLGWARLHDGRDAWSLDDAWLTEDYGTRLGVSLSLGLGLGVLVVAFTRVAVARTDWARRLQNELSPLIGQLSRADVAMVAIFSGFGEELFFRGAMQPSIGLWFTSLIFGMAHVGPRRIYFVWGLWAFVMGLLLGAIFEATGVLWGPVLAHVWINDRNMLAMQRH